MRRFLSGLAIVMLLAAGMATWPGATLHAQTDPDPAIPPIALHVQAIAAYAQGVVGQVDLALMAAADHMLRGGEPIIIQASIRRYAERVPGLRAILIADATGKLLIDSFTYPTLPVELGTRPYFIDALAHPGRLIFTPPIIGGTSGIPFIPVARGIVGPNTGSGGGPEVKYVAIGVLNLGALMLDIDLCPRCFAMVLSDKGVPLSSLPAGMTSTRDVAGRVVLDFSNPGKPIATPEKGFDYAYQRMSNGLIALLFYVR